MAEAPKFDSSRLVAAMQLSGIFAKVTEEFHRARDLHGDQTHLPLGTGPDRGWMNEVDDFLDREAMGPHYQDHFGIDNVTVANAARARCQAAAGTPEGDTWEKILTEEYAEMLAESDPAKFEAEAIQVMAMLANAVIAARKAAG